MEWNVNAEWEIQFHLWFLPVTLILHGCLICNAKLCCVHWQSVILVLKHIFSLAYVFVLLRLLLPFHQRHKGLRGNSIAAGLDLLLSGGEFPPQNRGALLLTVFVNTTEYIIRCTLRLSSHLFGWNSHFPHDPPTNAYWKRNLSLLAHVADNLRFYPSAPCL